MTRSRKAVIIVAMRIFFRSFESVSAVPQTASRSRLGMKLALEILRRVLWIPVHDDVRLKMTDSVWETLQPAKFSICFGFGDTGDSWVCWSKCSYTPSRERSGIDDGGDCVGKASGPRFCTVPTFSSHCVVRGLQTTIFSSILSLIIPNVETQHKGCSEPVSLLHLLGSTQIHIHSLTNY